MSVERIKVSVERGRFHQRLLLVFDNASFFFFFKFSVMDTADARGIPLWVYETNLVLWVGTNFRVLT